jgi:hypothetical protein
VSFIDEMNLMEWLQFAMTGMVVELEKPGADTSNESAKKRGIHIVDGDEGSTVPESVSKKVSPEHVYIVFCALVS